MEHVSRTHRGTPEALATILYRLTGLSHEEVHLLIRMGGAYLMNRRCKDPNFLVDQGILVEAWWRRPLVMEDVHFHKSWVLHSNKQFLMTNKPSGLPTQGRRDADYLAFYELLKQGVTGYLGLHHRLDQDTSGLMIFCREKKANADMARLFAEHLMRKGYLAVCQGVWPSPQSTITVEAAISAKREEEGTRQEVHPKGKPATTVFEKIAEADGLILIACWPKTGRTHQIRVHLAHLGLPLLGDTLYGGAPAEPGFLLHCWCLAWPKTGILGPGRFRQDPPEPWHERLPQALLDGYFTWKETAKC